MPSFQTARPQRKCDQANRKGRGHDLRRPGRCQFPEARKLMAATTLGQLRTKQQQIVELDATIAAKIDTETEFEEEFVNADTYQLTLEEQIAFFTEFICKANLPPPSTVSPPPTTMSPPLVSLPTSAADTRSDTPGASLLQQA